jgi:hypothetical protein
MLATDYRRIGRELSANSADNVNDSAIEGRVLVRKLRVGDATNSARKPRCDFIGDASFSVGKRLRHVRGFGHEEILYFGAAVANLSEVRNDPEVREKLHMAEE